MFVLLQLHMFLPMYLVGVGGVLMVNGVAIYDFLTENDTKFLICRDALPPPISNSCESPEDIHGDANYIPVEFAGALASVVFFVSCCKYPPPLSLTHTDTDTQTHAYIHRHKYT